MADVADVTETEVKQMRPPIDMPWSSISDQLVVAVLADGAVVARGEQVTLAQLGEIFSEEAAKSSGRLVLVQADETAMHKRVVEVMEVARRAGLSNLAIATKPDE